MKKQQPITSKVKKHDIKLLTLAHADIRHSSRLRAQKQPNMLTQDTILRNHPPFSYPTNSIKKVNIRTPSASMCSSINDQPNVSTHKKNNTNDNKMVKLDVKELHGLPTPDSEHPSGALLHLDLFFYDVISIRCFT